MIRRPLAYPVFVSLALGAGLAVSLGGCKKEEQAEPRSGEAAEGSGGGDARALEAPAKGAPAQPPVVRIAADQGILGHLLLRDASKLLADVQQKIMVGQSAAFVNEGFLRMALGGQLGDKKAVATNVRLDAPLGCAVVDAKDATAPVGCVFAYKGGLAQLEKDLGAGAKQADAAGHAAHFRVEGTDLFADVVGEHLAVAQDPKVLDATRGYLEKQLLGRAPQALGDVEIVGYPARVRAAYAEAVDEFLEMAAAGDDAPADVEDPQLRKAIEVWREYNATSTRQTFERLLSFDQMAFALSVEEAGLRLRFAMIPKPGSQEAKDTEAVLSKPADPAWLAKLPAGVALAFVARRDPVAALEMKSAKEAVEAMTRAYAAWTGKDPAKVRAAYDETVRAGAEHYGEHQAFAVAVGGDAPVAVYLINQMRGDGARGYMRDLFAKATPEALLPEKARGYATWRLEPDAAEAAGRKVDRLVIEGGPKFVEKAEAAVKKDPDLAKVREVLGGWKLVVDTTFANGAQLLVWAPGGEKAAMERLLAAYEGKGGLGTGGAVARLAALESGAWFVGGLDAGALLTGLRSLVPEATRSVPAGIGGQLDDVAAAGSVAKEGIAHWQVLIRQSLIDGVRQAIGAVGDGAAAAAPVEPAPAGAKPTKPVKPIAPSPKP